MNICLCGRLVLESSHPHLVVSVERLLTPSFFHSCMQHVMVFPRKHFPEVEENSQTTRSLDSFQ